MNKISIDNGLTFYEPEEIADWLADDDNWRVVETVLDEEICEEIEKSHEYFTNRVQYLECYLNYGFSLIIG